MSHVQQPVNHAKSLLIDESISHMSYLPTYDFFCHQNNSQINSRFNMINFIYDLFQWQKRRELASMIYEFPVNEKCVYYYCYYYY